MAEHIAYPMHECVLKAPLTVKGTVKASIFEGGGPLAVEGVMTEGLFKFIYKFITTKPFLIDFSIHLWQLVLCSLTLFLLIRLCSCVQKMYKSYLTSQFWDIS